MSGTRVEASIFNVVSKGSDCHSGRISTRRNERLQDRLESLDSRVERVIALFVNSNPLLVHQALGQVYVRQFLHSAASRAKYNPEAISVPAFTDARIFPIASTVNGRHGCTLPHVAY
jgi:hypothetical protein